MNKKKIVVGLCVVLLIGIFVYCIIKAVLAKEDLKDVYKETSENHKIGKIAAERMLWSSIFVTL